MIYQKYSLNNGMQILKELNENYKELNGNYNRIKKEIESITRNHKYWETLRRLTAIQSSWRS